jgi:hypothetical protein
MGQYPGAPVYYPTAPPPAPPADDRGIREHDGLYLRFAVGLGRLGARFTSDISNELGGSVKGSLAGGGLAFELSVGGTPAPGLVVGGGLFFEGAGEPKSSNLQVGGHGASELTFNGVSLALLGPFADYYIDPKSGWHIQGALGLAQMTAGNAKQSGVEATSKQNLGGIGGMLGGGYEWWVGEQWSVGALVRGVYVSVESNRDQPERWSYQALALPEVLFSATYH